MREREGRTPHQSLAHNGGSRDQRTFPHGLDLDTIHALPDLHADTLYAAEVARAPHHSPEEVETLIARARQGDSQSREALVVSCLAYAQGVARFLYASRRPPHDDLLDLVQVASERMVSRLDRALATSRPAAYLRGIARRAIMDYCTYHAGLIQKPEYALAVLAKLNPHPATVESLDAPLFHHGKRLREEYLAAPAQQPEPDETSEQHRYTVIYDALASLPAAHAEALTRLHGLSGQPKETPRDLGRPELIRNRAYEARNKLRPLLAPHLRRLRSRTGTEGQE